MIAIIDSGGANIASVTYALERLGETAQLTADPDAIRSADRVILPGVGAAKDAMRRLIDKDLVPVIQSLTQPVIGLCLGMQLLFAHSDEGDVDLLQIIDAPVQHFPRQDRLTVPHMGWNTVRKTADHPLLHGLADDSHFYFVHSYRAPVGDWTIGACDYGQPFTAIAAKGNFMGCQFHPEKSGAAGAAILKNFVEMRP